LPGIDDPTFKLGIEEGIMQGYEKVLSLLQRMYLDDNLTPKTPDAEAVLSLARMIGADLRKELQTAARSRGKRA
jgi:hypothetical protein